MCMQIKSMCLVFVGVIPVNGFEIWITWCLYFLFVFWFCKNDCNKNLRLINSCNFFYLNLI